MTGYARTRNGKFRIGLDYSHRRGFEFCTDIDYLSDDNRGTAQRPLLGTRAFQGYRARRYAYLGLQNVFSSAGGNVSGYCVQRRTCYDGRQH